LQENRVGVTECIALALEEDVMIWLVQLVEVEALNVMEAS
jgi:hypothetical protein